MLHVGVFYFFLCVFFWMTSCLCFCSQMLSFCKCVISGFHLLWLYCSKTLDSVYNKQMLEKQLQARACSPRPKSSQPSLSPMRAPKGPSTPSCQPLQKPAQAKCGEMSHGISLSTTSNVITAICIRTRLSLPPSLFPQDIWSLIKPETTSGFFFLAVVLSLPAVLKWHN